MFRTPGRLAAGTVANGPRVGPRCGSVAGPSASREARAWRFSIAHAELTAGLLGAVMLDVITATRLGEARCDARVADLMTYAKALDVHGPVRVAVDVLTAS